ncbi:MAG: class I SAM-dependent methyltransferase [Aquabacterium sp.]|uniref:class I SAM-dependent methyltransferase n=1 Tax=Aquabacterium sp. TaxID=1872578 RepID=UPI0012076FBB|nr:class I SAM-dependent methyltransferase [Aquabacterium sp.]TAK93493.1 MAG: class I SAM-dependent methyltransferase [Aquabacterium sp.]
MARNAASISPTAHYTGYTWFAHGMSHPALVTPQGRFMHTALKPLRGLALVTGAPTLQAFLLARHRVIDLLLSQAIAEGRVSQVIEVAAGLSPRGWRFKQAHGDKLHYVEADLPDMAQRKRDLMQGAGLLTPGHEVVTLDALTDTGPASLNALADRLDPQRGTAIVTEGLVNYFDTPTVVAMWQRFGRVLNRFPEGLYLSDIHLHNANKGVGVQAFKVVLSTFVKGRVFLHFDNEVQAETELRNARFALAELHAPTRFAGQLNMTMHPGANAVRVIEARTNKPRID